MELDGKPKVGMQFDNLESAWKFWKSYGGKMGFGVRKDFSNKSKKDGAITSCRFVCSKEGIRRKHKRDYLTVNPRQETRTDCKARIVLRHLNEKLKVKEFVEEHNHVLHLPETTHMLASQRHISDVQAHQLELADESGIQQRATYALMSKHVGGRTNLGYTRLDMKNYLRTRRQKNMKYGEVGCLMGYFQDQNSANPLFFHKFQMDSDEQITNIFWADVRMQLDYAYFGDVVSLDTTYCTNNAHRRLALFSGFNHHRGVVIFGAALLYDETAASFKWLFEMFLKVHNQKKPQTIFTDQDRAMAKALQEHGSHFLRDFKACMYEYEEEKEFEEAWNVKRCLNPDVDIIQFFKHFERVVEDKRYNEWKCEFEAREKLPRLRCPSSPMLQQLAEVYTPIILDMFQDQFDLFSACCIKQRRQSESLIEYVIDMYKHKGEWEVLFHTQEKSVSCTCRRFEIFGILCCHALKVFEANDVKLVPDQYILKRWTKMARTGIIFDVNGNEVEEDPKFSHTLEIRSLCQRFVKLASEVTGKDEVLILRSATEEVIKKVEALRLGKIHGTNESDDPIIPSSNDMSIPTGIKKRVGIKRRSRPKSRVELQLRNRKASRSRSHPTFTHSQSESTDIGASSLVQLENSFSFTRLLMDQSEGSVSLGALEFGGDKL
ncbi:protein FAR1-RELATED SEQUENCE 5-like [Senna tora]|uniref:Protein FAR1-RELATED SEQUENCE 5-like n=1 Tax=Senna tora TaxID=362788 RepID=A0A834WK28_9FABA|nr:protein FAR1-RELATED SEQUENCE 5-like [Senna tora]